MEGVFATEPAEHWLPIIDAAGVPCGKVRTLDDVYGWEQTLSQGLLLDVAHATQGDLKLPGHPSASTTTPTRAAGRPTSRRPPSASTTTRSASGSTDSP